MTAKLIAVILCIAATLCILPALVALGGAFMADGGPTLSHVAAAYADPSRLAQLLLHTLTLTGGAVVVALLLGVPAGFLFFRTNLPGRRAWVLLCLLAACVPIHVTATAWMALFGMQVWLYSAWGAAWISGVAYAPLVTLICGACFATVERDAEEMALLETTRRGVVWHASLPRAAWGVAAAAMLVVLLTLWDITVTDILMIRTFAEEVFTQFQLGAGPQRAAAVSLPLVVVLLVVAASIARTLARHGAATLSGNLQRPATFDLGPRRYAILCAVAAVAALVVAVPLLALARAVGHPANLVQAWHTCANELGMTLCVTPLAATISTVAAVPAAWALVRCRRARPLLSVWLLLLVAVPSPLVGIGLIRLLNRDGFAGVLYDSPAALVAAYVIRALPFAVLVILPAARRIPRDLEESVVLDGGGWGRRVMSILVPLARPSMAMAWLLSMVLCLSEIGASFLVVPPGRATLSIRFFTLIHYGVYPDAAGICLILLGVVGVLGGGIALLLRPVARRML